MPRLVLRRPGGSGHRSHSGLCQPPAGLLVGSCTLDGTVISGSWSLSPGQSVDWSSARRSCTMLCAGCERCRFTSLSLTQRNCSWYATCDLSALLPESGFWSAPLEKTLLLVGAAAQPPPSPQPPPPRRATSGNVPLDDEADHLATLLPVCARAILARCKLRAGYEPRERVQPKVRTDRLRYRYSSSGDSGSEGGGGGGGSAAGAVLPVDRVYVLHYRCATKRREFQEAQLPLLGGHPAFRTPHSASN